MRYYKKGFTLIELLVVIVILGALAAFITGNFFTSLKKGRDARRKADLQQVQRALELYYEDKKAYPDLIEFGNEFADSQTGKIYMKKLPADPILNFIYVYTTDQNGSFYKLYSCIENTDDKGPGVNQDGYIDTNCNCSGSPSGTICKFGVSSTNVSP